MQDNQNSPPVGGDDDEAMWDDVSRERAGADAEAAEPKPEARREAGPEAGGDDQPAQPRPSADGIDWSSAPQELRDAHERALAEQKKRLAGQVSVLQRRLNEMQRQPAPQPRTEPQPAAGDSDDDLVRLRDEYPELADPIIKRIEAANAKIDGLLADRESREQAILQAQEQELLGKHPDFYDTIQRNGQAFQAWIATDAPVRFARIVESNHDAIRDHEGAAEVYTAFLAHLGQDAGQSSQGGGAALAPSNADRRSRQLRAAATPTPRTQGGVRPSVPDDADSEVLWEDVAAERRRKRQAR